MGTSKAGQHSQDLPSSLDLGLKQPSPEHLFSLRSAESECVSAATPFFWTWHRMLMNVRYEPAHCTHSAVPQIQSPIPFPLVTNKSHTVTQQGPGDRVSLPPTIYSEERYQVHQRAAESSVHRNPPPWTATPSCAEILSRTPAVLRGHLADDPDCHIPFQRNLMNQKSIVVSQISSGIENPLDSSSPTLATQRHAEINHESLSNEMFPPFYQAWSDDDFCNLCMSIYGAGTKTELRTKIVRIPLCMNEFLRGLFAAAVTEWVFNERYGSVPRD